MKAIVLDMYGVIVKQTGDDFVPYVRQTFPDLSVEEICTPWFKADIGELTSLEVWEAIGFQGDLEKFEEKCCNYEKEKGVKKTESGLLYKVIEEGAERPTSLQDTVRVHYTGMLKNGKKFESSHDAGNDPVQFPLDRVIKGWGEGLQHVGKGGKIILYIPSERAYGERGAGVFIGPNEALVFEVEVFDVFHAKGEKK